MNINWFMPTFDIAEMIGKIFASVDNDDGQFLIFTADNGDKYVFHHHQSCCESVYIEDIVGDLSDLVGVPILEAEVASNEGKPEDNYGSCTWTFYKFGTIKGHVNVRWYGESNGYYSESVDQSLIKVDIKDE